ncbi:glycoside hydrolase [Vagococcus carniphilus]|uniref:glycoside hydrolase n=1 Tax=Vagococcus carniphilus TaxID=218144 RepID=UPI003BAD8DC2
MRKNKRKNKERVKKVPIKVLMLICLSFVMLGCIFIVAARYFDEPLLQKQGKLKTDKDLLGTILKENQKYGDKKVEMKVDPKTLELSLKGEKNSAKIAGTFDEPISNFKEEGDNISWTYPNQKLDVTISNSKEFVSINFLPHSDETEEITWPTVSGDHYYLPIGEGKQISAKDQVWEEYFKGNNELDLNESFSMSFLTVVQNDSAATIVMDDNFDKQLLKDEYSADLSFKIKNNLNKFNRKQGVTYRVYLSDNTPVASAKLYQRDRINNKKFTTLSQKNEMNSNVEKLIGAPHIYYWQNQLLTEQDIKWQKFVNVDPSFFNHVGNLLESCSEDGREGFDQALKLLTSGEGYKFEKNTILTGINTVLAYPDFYHADIFKTISDKELSYLKETSADMPTEERFSINKKLLKSVLKDAATEEKEWGQKSSTDILKDMKKSGLNKAWIGLANWNQGLVNPSFVQEAVSDDYLIGPYDSYQSIHENLSLDWNTASFKNNKQVFDAKTIMKPNGEYVSGFLGKGRKVNQTLIADESDYRMKQVLSKKVPFNTWFLDTDAAGEIYNDFSPEHPTSIKDDVNARVKRSNDLTKKGLVVGTETGNDYFNEAMVFAHGIETPVIAWSDEDMRKNKESEYYIGGYGSIGSKIPERYSKVVSIKEQYKKIYIDPSYNIPLYKLVYNQSVITTHHWEWDSYKIEGETENRRLSEYLYNVPPMIHLDQESWKNRKEDIIKNSKQWERYQTEAITKEMTDFQYLTEDKLVQSTTYGDDLIVTVNYSDKVFQSGDYKIEPHKGIINQDNKITIINE